MAAHNIFKAGELFNADGAAGVHFASGDADLGAHAKFTAVSELGGGVVHDDGAVDLFEELVNHGLVFGDDGFGVVGAVVGNVVDRAVHACDLFGGNDVAEIFSVPIDFSGRLQRLV